MSSARDYTQATIKKLFASSGNQCAFSDCTQNIVDKEGNTIGEICHIEAAKQGGLRYNPLQMDEERAHYNNLLLLCRNHHTPVIDNPDNVDIYTVKALREMKENHEDNHMYEPYRVSQTVIEKILSMPQQSTEQNYSQNVTNQNSGNGTQVVSNAVKSEGNTFIGGNQIDKQTINYSTPDIDQSCQDRDIIDEIFQHILKNVPSTGITLKQMGDSKPFTKIKIKVPLNFPKQQMERFQEMLHQTWDKKELVKAYLAEQSAIDETKVYDLREHIQSEFSHIKNSDDYHMKIGDLQVIEQLSQQYITEAKRQDNPIYQANAKAIVLYFFEFCTIGQKTDKEIREQLKLL